MTEHDEPRPPLARCGKPSCTSWLSFSVCPYTSVWLCRCKQCADGEHDPTGSGDSALEALTDYCEVHFNCGPEELLVKEEHV